jgi:uncharacterized glyoxalase superfamily protein PhnB
VGFRTNRSVPASAIITVLFYPDPPAAVAWLTQVLPFTERLRNSEDRRQLVHGNGAVVVTRAGANANEPASVSQPPGAQLITLRVTGVDGLCDRAKQAGARVLAGPSDRPYGERQCTIVDPWGHPWTLSETVFDSDPGSWGGALFEPSVVDTLAVLLDLEERGWQALSTDAATARAFYADVLAEQAVMVFPGGMVLEGKAAILDSLGEPWARHKISDPHVVNAASDTAILTYVVTAQRDGQDEYRARIASTYLREDAAWRLVFHQHTVL